MAAAGAAKKKGVVRRVVRNGKRSGVDAGGSKQIEAETQDDAPGGVAAMEVPQTTDADGDAHGLLENYADRPDFGVHVYNDVLDVSKLSDAFIRDTDELFVSITFFLKVGIEPRTAHEALARQVWDRYTTGLKPGVDYDPAKAGVEWWVQKRVQTPGTPYEEISFHWDKHESLVDRRGINKHPYVATVTYLSDTGGPTVICEKRTPEKYGEMQLGSVGDVHVCYPVRGRHVAFDGRWLHGVPAGLDVDDINTPTTRYTFLANVWLDRRVCDRLPKAACDELNFLPPGDAAAPRFHDPLATGPSAPWRVAAPAADIPTPARTAPPTQQYGMGRTGTEFALHMWLPKDTVTARRRTGTTLFRIPDGSGEIVVGAGAEEVQEVKPGATKKKKPVTRRVVKRVTKS